jgi:hypothetical protein
LRLPGGQEPSWWTEALRSAEDLVPGCGAALLDRLGDPLRSYERNAAAEERSVALLSSFDRDGPHLLIATLTVPTRQGVPTGFGTLVLEVLPLGDSDGLFRRLARLAGDLTGPSRNALNPDHKPPSALAVGELTQGEAAQLGHDLWARDVRLAGVLTQPTRSARETSERLRAFKGDLVLIAHSRCGLGLGQVLASVPQTVERLDLLETEPDDLELEWRMWVDELLSELDGTSTALASEEISSEITWEQAATDVKALEGDYFVLTARARRQLGGTGSYPHPGRMADALSRLAAAARIWGEKAGSLGDRFEDWILREHDLRVSLHDDEIPRRRLHEFKHEGRTHNREAHVQVDDGVPFKECGRIYFALDHGSRSIIVDHVGLHLYRKKDW